MAEDFTPGHGGSFGEILCHRIHEDGLAFRWLAKRWNISVEFLGLVIYDHCKALMGYEDEVKDPWDKQKKDEHGRKFHCVPCNIDRYLTLNQAAVSAFRQCPRCRQPMQFVEQVNLSPRKDTALGEIERRSFQNKMRNLKS